MLCIVLKRKTKLIIVYVLQYTNFYLSAHCTLIHVIWS